MNQPKIRFENVGKTFRTKKRNIVALEDINFEIWPNEIVSIIGPSGCGKSTIIRMIIGIINPTTGNIYVDGYKYSANVPIEVVRKIGFIFQQPNLLPWLTVRENIMFPLRVFRDKDPKWEKVVDDLIEMAKMEEYANSYPKTLSGGMLQRVGTLRAMSHQPDILLMDEPFSALDEILREQLDMETMQMWEKLKQTIIFITHNVKEAVLVSDRVYVMDTEPGRIVEEVKIDLPRPRTREMVATKKYISYVDYLIEKIGDVDLEKIV